MEWIRISPNKLKIMLTAPDMRHYDLKAERVDCADEHTRKAFRHIFDDARTQTGFDTEGERLLVQLYTSRGGGCEIFVTKLGEIEGMPLWGEEQEKTVRVGDAKGEAPVPGNDPGLDTLLSRVRSVRWTAYRFEEMSALLEACRGLCHAGYRGQSSAYIDEDGKGAWFLFLELPVAPEGALPPFCFLSEYGVTLSEAGHTCTYLKEYGRVICAEGAVESLGAL